jgi:hypothetical protein
MRKIVLFILLFASITGYTQQNVVKIGLLGLSYGDYSLSYERALGAKSSLNLTAGYMNPNNGFLNLYQDIYVQDGVWIGDWYDGIHASVDYRFYTGEKGTALRGFYLSPYLRYWNLALLLQDEIEGDYFDVDTKLSSVGVGIQFGYQWLISKKISIDWYFLGIGAQKLTGNASWIIKDESAVKYDKFDYNSIIDDVNDPFYKVEYVKKNYSYEVTNSAMNVKVPLWLPDIRTGITIGYAF